MGSPYRPRGVSSSPGRALRRIFAARGPPARPRALKTKKKTYKILQNLTKSNKFHIFFLGAAGVVWAVTTGPGECLLALTELLEEFSRSEGRQHVPRHCKLRKTLQNLTKSNKFHSGRGRAIWAVPTGPGKSPLWRPNITPPRFHDRRTLRFPMSRAKRHGASRTQRPGLPVAAAELAAATAHARRGVDLTLRDRRGLGAFYHWYSGLEQDCSPARHHKHKSEI